MRPLDRRPWTWLAPAVCSLATGVLVPPHAVAAIEGGSRDAGVRARDAAAAPAAPASPRPLPPGHPGIDPTDDEEGDDEELPPGHPPPSTGGARGPHEMDRLAADKSDVDESLPPGTIVVEVRDKADQPLPRTDVTLGILQQSVAKGESRKRTNRQADESGTVRFDGLEAGGGVAYRVTVPSAAEGGETATFAAPPFQLDLHHGQRVTLHVYPVTSRIAETMIGLDGIIYMELKDDAIQFDELFRVYNLGAVTWVPSDVVITLPKRFKAFNAQKEMSDIGFEEVAGKGAKLRGTFGPGQHETHFRYQVPYDGDESVEFAVTLPPHVARMRVIAEASKAMTLRVNDFPGATSDRNQKGQRVVVTERQMRPGEQPIAELHMALENIPTEGPAKWITVAIAAATMALGLFVSLEQAKAKSKTTMPLREEEADQARTRLVAEIAALDRAHEAGEIGPKAYGRIRDVLIDALARIMVTSPA